MPAEFALQACFETHMPGFDLTFEVGAAPELVVIFGASGSGKSMAIRTLAGLHSPEKGRIDLQGRTLFDSRKGINLRPQERKIGYVPQNYALFPHRTVAQNIAYGLRSISPPDIRQRVAELLRLMRLEDQAHRFPRQLSGGQQQRTALARALAIEPDLLLMDEPFGALDESLRSHLRDELQRIQRRYNIPVLMVTHNLEEAYLLADQLIIVERGKVVQAAPREVVFRQPKTPSVGRLMGMSNILRGRVCKAGGRKFVVDIKGIELIISRDSAMQVGDRVQLGIRPEEIIVVRKNRPLQPELEENLLEGVIIQDRPQGFDHLTTFAIPLRGQGNQELLVRMPHLVYLRLGLSLGERRTLSIKPSSVHLFPSQAGSPLTGKCECNSPITAQRHG